jgi:hypothetical protein
MFNGILQLLKWKDKRDVHMCTMYVYLNTQIIFKYTSIKFKDIVFSASEYISLAL